MKSINIKTYILNFYIPSPAFRQIRDILMRNGVIRVSDLCQKTEAEISSIPYLKGKNLQAIKSALQNVRLRFGMTEADLREYNELHFMGGFPD